MANFVVCVDPDAERRRAFLAKAEKGVHLLPGLVGGTCVSGDFCAAWAAGRHAPVSASSGPEGAHLVLGLAFHVSAERSLDAHGLAALWREVPVTIPPPLDGYHAAVSWRADAGRLVIGTDLLGVYPLYVWSDREVTLAGSSAALFRHHPAFRTELDPEGLAGILLTMVSFDGRTLMKGVRRPEPGRLVVRERGGAVGEHAQYRIALSDELHGLPFTALADRLDAAMQEAVSRHVTRDRPHLLLLSGGLDSRTIAGYLAAGRHPALQAGTFGRAGENEMRFARRVARRCGLAHRRLPLARDRQAEWARHHARWTHLAQGFHSIEYWQATEALAEAAPRLANGYLLDAIAGGSHIDWAMDWRAGRMSDETFLARVHQRAFVPEGLKTLVRDALNRALVDDMAHRVREKLRSLAPSVAHRAWLFDLQHRQRFHTGSILWTHAFGGWPVAPALSRGLLHFAAAVPIAALAERALQRAVLQARFPDLAAIEFDRGTEDTSPLVSSLGFIVRQRLAWRLRPVLTQLGLRQRWWARRYHAHGFYDINGEAWRTVRRAAAAPSDDADPFFACARLRDYLRAPEEALPVRDPITDGSGQKLVLGYLLWRESLRA